MEGISLAELNKHVRRILALNFPEPLWVRAELSQVSVSRGHYYLDLLQQSEEDGNPIAQARANLWSSQWQQLRRTRGAAITELFRPGLELLLKVEPALHERYGYSLRVIDIDPGYTEGVLGKARRDLLRKLEEEGLLAQNAKTKLPLVAQRVAVISSEQAAGYADFRNQLRENDWGYDLKIQLFRAAVQGVDAASEISKRLREIGRRKDEFDLVCILRGGGSKIDLLAFDQEDLCRTAAASPLPILAAIGHETDQSVLDVLAHTSVKTPTAAAVFLINRMAEFEHNLLELKDVLKGVVNRVGQVEKVKVEQQERALYTRAKFGLSRVAGRLDLMDQKLVNLTHQNIAEQKLNLDQKERVLEVLDPKAVLARGYALVSQRGKLISRAGQAEKNAEVQINWADGHRRATLNQPDSGEGA